MPTCSAGHATQSTDYCDVCGTPIAPDGTSGPTAPSAPPAPQQPETAPCPNCNTVNPQDALFCEACGYDYTTGALPRPSEVPSILDLDLDAPVSAPSAAGPHAPTPPAPGPPAPAAPRPPAPQPAASQATAEFPGDQPSASQGPAQPDASGTNGAGSLQGLVGLDAPAARRIEARFSRPEQPSARVPLESPGAPSPGAPAPVGTGAPTGMSVPRAPQGQASATPHPSATPQPSANPHDPGVAHDAPQAPSTDFDWIAEVWIDPEWYAIQQAPDPLPSMGLPTMVPLRKRSLLVGRPSRSRGIAPDIDGDPDSGISRRQAQLTSDGRRWYVEDLGSANGTYVAPAAAPLPTTPLAPGRHELQPDDRIFVGAWTRIVLRRATPEEQQIYGA
ncbi:FHA domain-containing protein [Mariniluteicoccus endophyticus]